MLAFLTLHYIHDSHEVNTWLKILSKSIRISSIQFRDYDYKWLKSRSWSPYSLWVRFIDIWFFTIFLKNSKIWIVQNLQIVETVYQDQIKYLKLSGVVLILNQGHFGCLQMIYLDPTPKTDSPSVQSTSFWCKVEIMIQIKPCDLEMQMLILILA